MSWVFQFHTGIAKITGNGDEAAFVHRVYRWVLDNEANGRNEHNGKTWTYDSMAALSKIFDWLSVRQIERVVRNCIDLGLIETGNFNKNPADQTKWYTVTETVKCIYANGEMETTERWNPSHETVDSLKEQIKDTHIDTHSKSADLFFNFSGGHAERLQALRDYEQMRKAKKKPMTKRAKELLLLSLEKLAPQNPDKQVLLLEQSILKCWDTVYPLDEDKQSPRADNQSQTQGGRKWVTTP